MIGYTLRPIHDRSWLRPATKRKVSQFKSNWSDTLDLLRAEVEWVNGKNLVIEVDVTDADMRLDGGIRARSKTASPAVIVSFDSTHGPLMYRCDAFVRAAYKQGEDWHQNVRAIALTLNALRAVGRYSAANSGEQYQGWTAITAEPYTGTVAATMGRDEAISRLVDLAEMSEPGVSADTPIDRLLTLAGRNAHPDRGGSSAMWNSFTAASEALSR